MLMINISSQIKSQKYNANSNVAFRNNLTSSDVKHNSDQISLNDSDRKQHKKKIVKRVVFGSLLATILTAIMLLMKRSIKIKRLKKEALNLPYPKNLAELLKDKGLIKENNLIVVKDTNTKFTGEIAQKYCSTDDLPYIEIWRYKNGIINEELVTNTDGKILYGKFYSPDGKYYVNVQKVNFPLGFGTKKIFSAAIGDTEKKHPSQILDGCKLPFYKSEFDWGRKVAASLKDPFHLNKKD